jgi:Arc/MetJ-type ribon-helix-helix transcriptional regulator
MMSPEVYAEKVSVNINTATLSSIDLLVDNGYYSNRSDFINQAVRAELQRQQSVTERIIRREEKAAEDEYGWFLGIFGITPKMVEDSFAKGECMDMTGYGLLIIHEGCDEEKLFQVIKSIRVRGRVKASASVKAHYGIK